MRKLQRMTALLGWICLAASAATALFVLVSRFQVERPDRQVAIILDGRSFAAQAAEAGKPLGAVLRELKEQGATAVALAEQDLAALHKAGTLKAMTGWELRRMAASEPVSADVLDLVVRGDVMDGYTYVLTDDSDMLGRMAARLGSDRVRQVRPGVLEVAYARDRVAQFTFGFDPEEFRTVQEAGLGVVLRPANFPTADAAAVQAAWDHMALLAPDPVMVIFQGNEVLGYPEAVGTTADALRARGWLVGLVEQPSGKGYIVQKGSDELTERLDYRVTKVTTRGAGMTDRGARALYVRPEGAADLQAAVAAVHQAGFEIGKPSGLRYLRVGRAFQVLLSLGIAGALMLGLVHAGRPRFAAAAGGAALLAAALWPYVIPILAGRVQLLTVAVYPVLAVVLGQRAKGVAAAGWFAAAGLAAAAVGLSLRSTPAHLLGMVPEPSLPEALGLSLGAAALAGAWLSWDRLDFQAPVTMVHAVGAALLGVGLGVAVTRPAWGAALIGAAVFARSPAKLGWAWFGLGLVGAVSLGLAPAGAALGALIGLAAGVALYLILTSTSSVAPLCAGMVGEGRPRHD